MSDETKTPEFDKLEAVKVPTTRALLATHAPELLPSPLDGGYTWDNANAPIFVGPFVSMVDAGKALTKDISALEARHEEEIKQAQRAAYEDAARMADELFKDTHCGCDPAYCSCEKLNAFASEATEELAYLLREKAGKL